MSHLDHGSAIAAGETDGFGVEHVSLGAWFAHTFFFGIDLIVIASLLCSAARAFNAAHAKDERVFAHPAKIDGRSQNKISYA